MKTDFRPWVIVIFLLLIGFNSESIAQDIELLREYTLREFNISELIGVDMSYLSSDFSLASKNKKESQAEKPSMERIIELKDSLEITDDALYFKKLGLMYNGLNMADSGRFYLKKAETRYSEELNKNPNDTKVLHDIMSLKVSLGYVNEAIEIAYSILKINPRDLTALYSIIELSVGNGDYTTAKEYCEKLMKEFPENPAPYFWKTMVTISEESNYMFGKTKKSFQGFNFDDSFLEKAAAEYPDDPEMQLATITFRFTFLFYDIMIPFIQFNPPDPDSILHVKIPLSADDSVHLAGFESHYLEMLEDETYNAHHMIYYSLGIIDFIKGDYLNAIKYFEKSIEQCGTCSDNNISSSFNNIRTSFLFQGDTLKAKESIERKINRVASDFSKAKGYIELATCEMLGNNREKGSEYLEKALELNPNAYEAYIGLANLSMLAYDFHLAQVYLDKCYTINQYDTKLYRSFVLLTLFQGDLDTAAYLVNKFLRNDPKDTFFKSIKKDFLE